MTTRTEIIAEIAQGYEGNPKLAELLVKGALAAGADSIKLQLVYADELCVTSYPYYTLFSSLEMPDEIWHSLVLIVHNAGKRIYFDVFGQRSLDLAKKFGADGVKISTTDFHNLALVKQAFSLFDIVFVSIGGISAEYIDEMISSIPFCEKLILMHGFQAEPTQIEENNLARIRTLKLRYDGVRVGFMDHSLGCSPEALHLPLLALGVGVDCIDKHMTLDYCLKIEDYVSALSIDRFEKFVTIIRSMELAFGSADLTLTDREMEYGKRAGKVLVASNNLPKGHRITEGDIVMKRVGTVPMENHFRRSSDLVGKSLLSPLGIDCPYEVDSVK
jgi:N,N'-diacetyllegionaminate synthase